jgi:hypothetical protein
VIVLALARHDQRLADMAGGNNVSESTVRRWCDELVALLASQAPRLDRALKKGSPLRLQLPGSAVTGPPAPAKCKATVKSSRGCHIRSHGRTWSG